VDECSWARGNNWEPHTRSLDLLEVDDRLRTLVLLVLHDARLELVELRLCAPLAREP
jgi:hypothetical protein